MTPHSDREKTIYKVTWVGFGVNVALTVGKLLCGFLGRSGAMIADGVHSLSDFVTDFVVLLFVKLSAKPKDEKHDYGHGKFETLATILIGLSLFGVAVGIVVQNVLRIADVVRGDVIPRPAVAALLAAGVSIIAKELLFWYTLAAAKRINSPAVKANAWHHRSDAISSVASLLGIGGAFFFGEQWRILDPIAALVVALLIGKVAYGLVVPGISEMLERSLPAEVEREIRELVMQESKFQDFHNLKTRRIGAYVAIEFHVRVYGGMSVFESHGATSFAERRLRERFGGGTQIIIHVEPVEGEF